MTSLNEIAEIIAHSLGRQFDYTLRESIKFSVLWWREELIRRDLDRNGFSPFDYLQSMCFKFDRVDSGECILESGKTILKSDKQIPKPVRLKSNGRSNFMFVGSSDRSKAFTFATEFQLQYLNCLAYNHNTIYYTYKDNHIYLLNNLNIYEGFVEGIFSDPRGYNTGCGKDTFTDDSPLPISSDLLKTIREGIINGEFPLVSEEKNINKKEDE